MTTGPTTIVASCFKRINLISHHTNHHNLSVNIIYTFCRSQIINICPYFLGNVNDLRQSLPFFFFFFWSYQFGLMFCRNDISLKLD
jgi:hypothetical protein